MDYAGLDLIREVIPSDKRDILRALACLEEKGLIISLKIDDKPIGKFSIPEENRSLIGEFCDLIEENTFYRDMIMQFANNHPRTKLIGRSLRCPNLNGNHCSLPKRERIHQTEGRLGATGNVHVLCCQCRSRLQNRGII